MKVITIARLLALSALPLLIGNTVQAEDDADAEAFSDAELCISLTRLDRTDIIDDRNILFHMRGDEIYLNQLPHRCSGLRMADGFSYRRTISRLCKIDLITPLPRGGFGGGISCGLGTFRLITAEEAMAMKEGTPTDTPSPGEGSETESTDDDAQDEVAEIESIE